MTSILAQLDNNIKKLAIIFTICINYKLFDSIIINIIEQRFRFGTNISNCLIICSRLLDEIKDTNNSNDIVNFENNYTNFAVSKKLYFDTSNLIDVQYYELRNKYNNDLNKYKNIFTKIIYVFILFLIIDFIFFYYMFFY